MVAKNAGCYDREMVGMLCGAPELKWVEGRVRDGFLVEVATVKLLH